MALQAESVALAVFGLEQIGAGVHIFHPGRVFHVVEDAGQGDRGLAGRDGFQGPLLHL